MGVKLGDMRYWNKVFVYSTVNTIIYYIFEYGIYIEMREGNTAPLKLFNKLNFKKCGEYFEDEDFKFIVMEKLKKQSPSY